MLSGHQSKGRRIFDRAPRQTFTDRAQRQGSTTPAPGDYDKIGEFGVYADAQYYKTLRSLRSLSSQKWSVFNKLFQIHNLTLSNHFVNMDKIKFIFSEQIILAELSLFVIYFFVFIFFILKCANWNIHLLSIRFVGLLKQKLFFNQDFLIFNHSHFQLILQYFCSYIIVKWILMFYV